MGGVDSTDQGRKPSLAASYSVEDITNALDDMLSGDEFLNEELSAKKVPRDPVRSEPVRSEPVRNDPVRSEPVRSEPVRSEPVKSDPVKSEPVKNVGAADRELDALSRALQGFDSDNECVYICSSIVVIYCPSPSPRTGEADQLLADIDNMLADLNTHIDFSTTEFGSDV